MSADRYLAGRGENKYIFFSPNTKMPDNQEIPKEVGRTCEKIITGVWEGKINLDTYLPQLDKSFRSIQNTIGWRFNKTLSTYEYLEAMEQIEAQDMKDIFNILGFKDTSTITSSYGKTYEMAGALAVTREILYPTLAFSNSDQGLKSRASSFVKGKFIGDVRGSFGQFDGVVLPEKTRVKNGNGLLNSLEEKRKKWLPVEIKLPLRVRFISGTGKIKGVFSWDEEQFMHRLGNIILDSTRKNANLRLPDYAIFIYLRGILPSVTHLLKIDSQTWSDWYDRLELIRQDLQPVDPRYEEVQNLVSALIGIANNDKRFQKERVNHKLRKEPKDYKQEVMPL